MQAYCVVHLLNMSGDPQPAALDTMNARNYFQQCVSTRMDDNYEYRLANVELERLIGR